VDQLWAHCAIPYHGFFIDPYIHNGSQFTPILTKIQNASGKLAYANIPIIWIQSFQFVFGTPKNAKNPQLTRVFMLHLAISG
jgi:hypothetical protein